MNSKLNPAPQNGTVDIALERGPDGMPSVVRAGQAAVTERKLKIPFRGGYEHFELVGDLADLSRATFRWTMRTRIAE